MILNCPSCSAKFMVSSEALGAAGRDVRCGKCGHVWFQGPERDSLDELDIDLGDHDFSSDKQSDNDLSFETHIERTEPNSEILKPKAEEPRQEKTVKEATLLQRQIAGAMVALAFASVIFYALVAPYKTIGRAVPFMGAAYEKMGWPMPKAKKQIAFERLKLAREGKKIKGSGLIVNLTSEDQPLNYMTVDLLDLSDKVVKTFDIKMASTKLKAEASEPVEFFVDEPPKDAVSVRIRLVQ